MAIRLAVQDDFEAIQELNRQIFEVEIDVSQPRGWNPKHPYSEFGIQYFQNAINQKDRHVAFVYVQDNVVGYVILNIVSENETRHRLGITLAQINTLCVDKNYRSKGIGRKLVEHGKEWARQNGANQFMVQAMAENLRAIDFYKECGFEPFEIKLEMEL